MHDMSETAWSDLGPWLDLMAKQRRLGPGCGRAEFEGADWLQQAEARMRGGTSLGLVYLYRDWLEARRAMASRAGDT